MRDDEFEMFIEEMGESTTSIEVPSTSIEKYRGKLPDQLLEYWKDEGWSGYQNGLFWLTNPEDYDDLVDEWLDDTPYESIDHYHVIARSAFGKLYLWGEYYNQSFTISCPMHSIIALDNELETKSNDPDSTLRSFFAVSEPEDFDIDDQNGEPLFERARAKFGDLEQDEMYGFKHAIATGGQILLENLEKVKLDQHLTILRQLAKPNIPYAGVKVPSSSL